MSISLGLESSDDLAEYYGGQEVLRKDLKEPKDFRKEIMGVTAEDIRKLAKEIFKNERLNLALVGKSKKEDFEGWLKI
jgi:predicted Zn-dependent peptidase